MPRMEYRKMLISWAFKREKKLGFTTEDRADLLGTHMWKLHTTSDIKAYVEILDEELKEKEVMLL